jgi:hypothetical protein
MTAPLATLILDMHVKHMVAAGVMDIASILLVGLGYNLKMNGDKPLGTF